MQSKHARPKSEAEGPNDGCLPTPEPSLRASMANSDTCEGGSKPKEDEENSGPATDAQGQSAVVSDSDTATNVNENEVNESEPKSNRRGSNDSTPDESEPSRSGHKRAPSPTPSSASSSTMRRRHADVVGQIFLGVYPYAGDVGDLSFQKGEEIVVLNSDDGDWCVQCVLIGVVVV